MHQAVQAFLSCNAASLTDRRFSGDKLQHQALLLAFIDAAPYIRQKIRQNAYSQLNIENKNSQIQF
ncbi:hypothetical protein [Janthinobacterium agaricidamnosum]|uniref:hypothetical protein n=1 Tax=Janthinobacterium agaricidamnosum TaxID=55508 RepID=UPI001186A042|nr:hypothetical protein [Janthinobacterium agaricidamnosum]